MPKIIILSAPSGTGKTTLRDIAIKEIPGLNKVVTMTTREPRKGENHGVDYHFMTRNGMKEIHELGGMIEMVESYGNFYGTPKSEINYKLDAGDSLIIIIDSFGKINFDKFYDTIGIFITPPSEEVLTSRLLRRTEIDKDDLPDLRLRLSRANEELKFAQEKASYKYYIDGNQSLEDCTTELMKILREELNINE